MVIRYFCRCVTCGAAHTLRISVGHNPYQEHTFSCGECGEDMAVGMIIDIENVTTTVEPKNNCEEGQEEGIVVNLHPEFTVPADQVHTDRVFPWMEHTRDIFTEQVKKYGLDSGLKSLQEAKESAMEIQSPLEGWAIIKKSWSLMNNGRIDLAKIHLAKYKDHYFDAPAELNHVLYHFCGKMLGSAGITIFENAAEYIGQLSKMNPSEFQKFRSYYRDNWHSDHLYRFFEVISDYFRDFTEFSQTLLFVQYNLPLRQGDKATSSAFKRTKMFYGNAFEALTSNMVVLACLNNIDQGRSYDQFSKMDLKKYLTTNKARRGNPFRDNPTFFEFARIIDATLRNASHHGAMKIDNKRGVITYQSGGTGALKSIPYAGYLYSCNEIFFRVIALLMLELTIDYQQKS